MTDRLRSALSVLLGEEWPSSDVLAMLEQEARKTPHERAIDAAFAHETIPVTEGPVDEPLSTDELVNLELLKSTIDAALPDHDQGA